MGRKSIIFAACAVIGTPKLARAIAPDGALVQFNDNGFWSWFQDERAIIDPNTNQLLIGSVASGDGAGGAARDGNDDVVSYNLSTGATSRFTLIDFTYVADDHFSPALLVRPDGRYLAIYCAHQNDSLIRWRISTNPGDISSWSAEQSITLTSNQGTTYSNAFYLSSTSRMYDFFRGNNYDPHLLSSTNNGANWSYTGHLLMDPGNNSGLRPYLKYTSNGTDRVYFISTQSHPRESNTGIYAGYITPGDGNIHQVNGTIVGTLGTNTGTAVSVTSLSTVFAAQPEGVIGNRTHFWTTDVSLDSAGNPYALFTSRTETDTNNSTADTTDHRFYYARWNGSSFGVHEIAKAGGFLYSSEQDYTGLGALSPSDPNTLYISTKIDPRDGTNTSHYEIYRGFTSDDGTNWSWIPITTGSTSDNLRPIVPKWDSTHTALLWFQGTYTTYQHANAAVVGKFYTGNNGLWKNSLGGAWETASNWRDQRPADGMSFIADFSTLDILGNVNVTQSGQRSLGFLAFGDANPAAPSSWTLAGGTLLLDGGVIAPTIQVKNQTATIGSTLAGSSGLIKTGAGVLQLIGDNTYTGPTTVQAGELIAKRFLNTALAINAGSAQVIAGASPNSADGMSIVPALSIAPGAQLDLTNNSLAIDYTTLGTLLTDVRNDLLTGRLTTSLSAGGFALGYADQSSLLIRYVYSGDTNLDGTVNALDFNAMASNFGSASGRFWTDGDVNYDGAVNTLDFDAVALNFNRSLPSPLGALIPEPASLSVLSAAALFIRRENKRRGRNVYSTSALRLL